MENDSSEPRTEDLEEETRNSSMATCGAEAATAKSTTGSASSSSYFISITVHQPRLRIKIPKFLVDTFRRSFDGNGDDEKGNSGDERENWRTEPAKLSKFVSMISGIFGGRKSPPCSDGGKVHGEDGDCSADSEAREDFREKIAASESSQSFEHDDREKIFVADKKTRNEKNPIRSRLPLSKSTLFSKKKAIDFIKSKICRRSNKNSSFAYDQHPKAFGSRENFKRLLKVPFRVLATRRKQIAKDSSEVSRHQEEEDGERLWQKKILMGERCKPLSASGQLQYDKYGVLLPEIIH